MPIAAECPFYRYEKNKITYCECVNLHFPDLLTRQEILANTCGHPEKYKTCPFYVATTHYYERKFKAEEANP